MVSSISRELISFHVQTEQVIHKKIEIYRSKKTERKFWQNQNNILHEFNEHQFTRLDVLDQSRPFVLN